MGTFAELPAFPVLDFTAEQLDKGDTVAFIAKMNSYMSKIVGWTNAAESWIDDVNNAGSEIEAVQFSSIAEVKALQALVASLQLDIANLETIATVDLTQLQSKATEVEAIIATAGSLTIANISGLTERLARLPSSQVFENQLPEHGSFLAWDENNPDYMDRNAAAFSLGCMVGYLEGSNGTDISAGALAGRFYYDSATNGGVATSNNAVGQKFATDMGLLNSRYAASFGVAKFIVGTANNSSTFETDSDGTYYRCLSTGGASKKISRTGNVSISFWVRPIVSPMYIRAFGSGPRATYIDGVHADGTAGEAHNPSYYKLNPSQVYHIATTFEPDDNASKYTSAAFFLMGKPGAEFQLSCLIAVGGVIQLEKNAGPIRTQLGIPAL